MEENRDEACFDEEHWTLVDHPPENSDNDSAQVVPGPKNLGSWSTISSYMSKVMTWVKQVNECLINSTGFFFDFPISSGIEVKVHRNFFKKDPGWLDTLLQVCCPNLVAQDCCPKLVVQDYYMNMNRWGFISFNCVAIEQRKLPTTQPITAEDKEIAVNLMIHYIYTGEVNEVNLETHAREVLELAEEFGLKGLKRKAEYSLISSMNPENVVPFFIAGCQQNAPLLQVKAFEFISQNPQVKHSSSFVELQVKYSEFMAELGLNN